MRLVLDAGHGNFTSGNRIPRELDTNNTSEWWLNDRIARFIAAELKDYNVDILRVDDTTGRTDVALATRTQRANAFNPDFTLSIHHNAGARLTTAGGITIHIHPNATSPVPEYQRALYDTLIRHTGLRGNRASPIGRDNFHMLREISGYKSILVEHGFMDSRTDAPIILTETFARTAAKAHAEFLINTFNLRKDGTVISSTANRKHPVVKPVQEAIIHLNRPTAQIDGGAQGIIGPTTDRAIKAIQKGLKMPQDGVISYEFLGGLLDLLRAATRGINPVTHEQVVQQLERAQREIKTLTNNLRIESSRLTAAKAELNNAVKAKDIAEKYLYKTEGELAYEKAKVAQLEIEIDKFAANLKDKEVMIRELSEKTNLQTEYIEKLKELHTNDLIAIKEIHKEKVAALEKQLNNATRAEIKDSSIGELFSLLFRKVAELLHR